MPKVGNWTCVDLNSPEQPPGYNPPSNDNSTPNDRPNRHKWFWKVKDKFNAAMGDGPPSERNSTG